MKKNLVLIFVFVFAITINCKAISQNLSYKNEINNVVKKQIPYSKKQIKYLVKEIKNEKNEYVRKAIIEQGINSIILEFYIELAHITNKYFDISKNIPKTDYYQDVKDVVTPYLENNRADISKINNFLKYADKKQLDIERKYGY